MDPCRLCRVVERSQHDQHDRAERGDIGEPGAVGDRQRADEEEERESLVQHSDRATPVGRFQRALRVFVGETREGVADRTLHLEDPDFLQRRRELGEPGRVHEIGVCHLTGVAADLEAERAQDQTDEQRRRCGRDGCDRAHDQRSPEQREQVESGDRATGEAGHRADGCRGVRRGEFLQPTLALLRLQLPVRAEEPPEQCFPDSGDGRVRRAPPRAPSATPGNPCARPRAPRPR